MKVFVNKLHGGYCGGLILVAANTPEEAHAAFHNDKNLSYMYDDINREGECDESKVYDHYYQRGDWKELPMLSADVDTPQVIIESSHKE